MPRNHFSLRKDRRGLRPVYNLGNEHGDCPNHCKFCDVGRSPRVDASDNLRNFIRLHAQFMNQINEPYHPLIYNQGNVTNPIEFSESCLQFILNKFNNDPRVVYVSLNSRQSYVTHELLESLIRSNFSFPIHFIFGLESISRRATYHFGKDTSGELERFIQILHPYNKLAQNTNGRNYNFGLDVNLVFLPEMYLADGEKRVGNEELIADGMRWELKQLLSQIDPMVPVEINLHPYYQVQGLPYESMDLSFFMEELPSLQVIVEKHNQKKPEKETHLFIGIEGGGYDQSAYQNKFPNWIRQIDIFNATGILPELNQEQ